jgi:tetratricopeptide (TPR) repeat protein
LTAPEGSSDQLLALAEEAIDVFREAGDEAGLARAWGAMGEVENMRCHFGAEAATFEQAMLHARRAGDERLTVRMATRVSHAHFWGPTPVEEALSWIEEQPEFLRVRPGLLTTRALLEAMRGQFDLARSLTSEARARQEELGARMGIANALEGRTWIEIWAGELESAEKAIREACELHAQVGEKAGLSTRAGLLARVLCTLGRYDEAEEWSGTSEELGASDDIATQQLWRLARGRVLAHQGEFMEAERLMREALALIEQTDNLSEHGNALMEFAEVLELAGRREEAAAEVRRALELYERKGHLVLAERTRARLAELQALSAGRRPSN